MCGIFVSARTSFYTHLEDSEAFDEVNRKLRAVNAARGPDGQKNIRRITSSPSIDMGLGKGCLLLDFFASELRLRGNLPVVQPHEHVDGDVLCWNGEIFEGMDISPEENDGGKLFDAIRSQQTPDALLSLLNSIEGPYAFVFYSAASRVLYFGVDPLSRRSLLIHKPSVENPYFLLSSVSVGSSPLYDLEEMETESVFCLDVQRLSTMNDIVEGYNRSISVLPRYRNGQRISHSPYAGHIQVNTALPPENTLPPRSLDDIPLAPSLPVDDLISQLDRSVMLQVKAVPRFPLSHDEARVAILFSGGIDSTVLAFLAHRHLPPDEPIDLLNVAFENQRKIQGQTHTGGTRKRKLKMNIGEESHQVSYLVPDRLTGLQELEELRRVCPGRMWNFIEVNVPQEESQAARPIIEALMWPSRTVMDLSLAMALYFASRGIGKVKRTQDTTDGEPYTSRARVLLSGLGSDELLGGYYRHRTAFDTGGWRAVIEELRLELQRIPKRNLGRDDRVISSHGKETRHPFLSLSVVSFIAQLPVHCKMDPRAETGVGDKMLLRLAARRLGLVEASGRKKRAMQFGSHSARMEEGEKRGDLLLC